MAMTMDGGCSSAPAERPGPLAPDLHNALWQWRRVMPIPFLPKMLDGLPPAVGAMLSHRNRLGSMPRTYLIFGDIEGKLNVLRVECTKVRSQGPLSRP